MADDIEIFYVPIGVQTYIPITEENIETSASRYGIVDDTSDAFLNIKRILQAAPDGDFNNEMLRVKMIVSEREIIYIDDSGGVLSSINGTSKLSREDVSHIKAILESFTSPLVRRQ